MNGALSELAESAVDGSEPSDDAYLCYPDGDAASPAPGVPVSLTTGSDGDSAR